MDFKNITVKKSEIEKNALQKILSVIFVILVLVVSIIIFSNREKLNYNPRFGYLSVLLLSFISNASVLLPAPSLIVVIVASQVLNPILVSLVAALGTTLGETIGYFSGRAGKILIKKSNYKMKGLQRPFLKVLLLAAIPLPMFDVIGLVAGYNRMPIIKFVTACFIGKAIKMITFALISNKIGSLL